MFLYIELCRSSVWDDLGYYPSYSLVLPKEFCLATTFHERNNYPVLSFRLRAINMPLVLLLTHTTLISSCLPSKFCSSRRQTWNELFVTSSVQMRAASYSWPVFRCSEVTRTTGASVKSPWWKSESVCQNWNVLKITTTKKQFEKDWVKEGILRAAATLISKNWKNGEIGKRNIKCFPSTRVHTSPTRFQNVSFLAKMNTVRFSEIYEKRFRKVLFWVDNSSRLVWTKGRKINQSIVVFTRRDLTSF